MCLRDISKCTTVEVGKEEDEVFVMSKFWVVSTLSTLLPPLPPPLLCHLYYTTIEFLFAVCHEHLTCSTFNLQYTIQGALFSFFFFDRAIFICACTTFS